MNERAIIRIRSNRKEKWPGYVMSYFSDICHAPIKRSGRSLLSQIAMNIYRVIILFEWIFTSIPVLFFSKENKFPIINASQNPDEQQKFNIVFFKSVTNYPSHLYM